MGCKQVYSVDFNNPESREKWKKFIGELYTKYYLGDYEEEDCNRTSREKNIRKKEKNKEKVREKRMKKAQITAKKAKQEEQIKERKSKIKTLITIDDMQVEKPKRRGRPPKDKNEEVVNNKQKTLL